MPDVYLGIDDINRANADLFEVNARSQVADVWAQQAPDIADQAQQQYQQQQQAMEEQRRQERQAAADSWAAYHAPAVVQSVVPPESPPATPQPAPTAVAAPPATLMPGAPAAAPAQPDVEQQAQQALMSQARSDVLKGSPFADVPVVGGAVQAGQNLASGVGQAVGGAVQAGGSLVDMARQAAISHGIDPGQFIAQINQESSFDPDVISGKRASPAGAQGIAQFMPDTARQLGIDPLNPAQALDAAAGLMARLKQKYGRDDLALAAYNAGEGNVDKYGGVPPFEETQRYVKSILSNAGQAVASNANTVINAVREVGSKAADRVSQFALGLASADAQAFCGPAAAIAFAQTFGRNPTVEEAKQLAQKVGWSPDQGMAGVESEQSLLQAMGVPTSLERNVDWNHVAQDVAGGNPVILDTPGHYYYVSGVRSGPNGQMEFHVGTSGTDLRGGGEWMTAQQINAMPQSHGMVRAALYADHPLGPGPSVATQQGDQGRTFASQMLGPDGQQPASDLVSQVTARPDDQQMANIGGGSPLDPLKEIGNTISNAITSGLQRIFGQPQAGPNDNPGAMPQPAQPALPDIGGAVGSFVHGDPNLGYRPDLQAQREAAAQDVTGARVSLPSSVGDVLGSSLGEPTGGEELSRQREQAIAENNPLRDVPFVGGASTLAGQIATDPTNLLLAAPAEARVAGEVAGAAERGLAAVPRRLPAEAEAGFAMGLPTGGPPAPTLTQSADPLIARAAQAMQQKPPEVPAENLVDRIVRASTNRFEAVDRYQEEALRRVGKSLVNPPQSLDLSAAIRATSDGAARTMVDRSLMPAVQAAGNDQEALSLYLRHANNVDVADALGNPNRVAAGFTRDESQQIVDSLPQELGPQRWQQVQDAAQQVYGYTNQLRQRMVDSGLISSEFAQQLQQDYPRWVPTRVLDYMDETQHAAPIGSKISLGDNQVRKYTEEGTQKFSEDPVASLVGLTGQVERLARKNEAANALVELDNLSPAGQRLLTPTDAPVKAGETVIQRINNGTVERYVAPAPLAAVINGPQITQAPGFVRAWTGFLRSVTTVLSPAFALVRNPSLDIPEYMTRSLADLPEMGGAGGNPLMIPHLVANLAKGYADAFKGFDWATLGLREGTLAGPATQRYMLGGGGNAGQIGRTFEDRADAVARMARDGIAINSAEDIGRILKDLVTLQPVARISERTELGPRVARMMLAEQAGATPARATLAGRRVTIDFNEGGTLAKTLNQYIPFFNAGVQGTAQIGRMFRDNPSGAVAAATMMTGLPAAAAELWNNADAQRARDYEDVPDYLKQQGVVVMLPGEAPTDDRGNRRPQFFWINMRGLAPFSTFVSGATHDVLAMAGNPNVKQEDLSKLLLDMVVGASPIRANTIGDVPGSFTPQFFPGASTGMQLVTNKDFFRNTDITNPRKDQYASAAGQAIANALTTVARLQNPAAQVHPAQVDFAIKDMLGGVGATALGASDIIAGNRHDNAPQSAPVIGGVARALGVRGDTGATLSEARSQILTPDAQRVLNDVGLQTPQPVTGVVHYEGYAIPLHQDEEARFQQAYSQRLSDLLVRYGPSLRAAPDMVQRQKVFSQLTRSALAGAQNDVLRTIPGSQISQRANEEAQRRRQGLR